MVQSPNLPAGYDEDYDEPEELALPEGTEPTNDASRLEGNGSDGALYHAGAAAEEAQTDQNGQSERLEQHGGQHDGRDAGQGERGQSTPPAAGHAVAPAAASGQAPSHHPLPSRPVPSSLPPKPTGATGTPSSTFSHAGAAAASAPAAPPSHAAPPGSNLPPGFTYNPALHPPRRHDLPVPEGLPGDRVADIDVEKYWTLRGHLNELCGISGTTRLVLKAFLLLWTSYCRAFGEFQLTRRLDSLPGFRAVNRSVSISNRSKCSKRKSESFASGSCHMRGFGRG